MEIPVLHEILHFFAWFCNRWQGFLHLPILFVWTYFDTPAVFRHYQKSSGRDDFPNVDVDLQSTRLITAFLLSFYMFCGSMLCLGLLVMPIKYMTDRSRPKHIPFVKRYLNMRVREGTQPSHPSGDSAMAAYFGGAYFFIFLNPYMFYFMTPLVCLGRVYM